jgi:CRISPR-associated protein Cas5d
MASSPRNTIQFSLQGRYALFTDPITKIGGEKCTYQIPTYEALKGVAKSVYWKPTIIWHIDRVRVMKPIRTQTKGTKPQSFSGGNDLAIYTFLVDVEYQVQAHFEWNLHRPTLASDRIEGKHFSIAQRMLERGGRQDIFLGTRDCQGYVEPCDFGQGTGHYDDISQLDFGVMFHGFDYPDESGTKDLRKRMTRPRMVHGVIQFERPEECKMSEFVRDMTPKEFSVGENLQAVATDAMEWGIS